MSGLIWAGIGKGIADAGTAVGSSMLRSITDDERQQDRLELARERQTAAAELQRQRLDQARETAQARLDAKGSGNGGGGGLSLDDIAEGGKAEGIVAGMLDGSTIPELRRVRAFRDGKGDQFKQDVTRNVAGPNDGSNEPAGADRAANPMARDPSQASSIVTQIMREYPPGFEAEMRSKVKALARIEEAAAQGKNYDSVTKGRQTQQEVDASAEAMRDPARAGVIGQGIAAGQGKELVGGDSNVTRNKFTGATTNTLVGDSQVRENNAQAGQAASAGRKSDADASRVNDRSDPETMRMRSDYTQRERTLRTQLSRAMIGDEKDSVQQELDALIQERKNFEAQVATRKPQAAGAKTGDNKPVVAGLPKGAVQIGTSGGKPVYQTPDGKKFIQN